MAATHNKANTHSSNGKNPSVSVIEKTVRRDSATGRIIDNNESKNSISKADNLTLRAWKKTFENRKKAA